MEHSASTYISYNSQRIAEAVGDWFSTYISYNSQRIAEAVGDWFFERGNVTAHTLAITLAIILCSGETIKTNYSLPACRPRFGWMVKGTFIEGASTLACPCSSLGHITWLIWQASLANARRPLH
jgi:hypothetical protein